MDKANADKAKSIPSRAEFHRMNFLIQVQLHHFLNRSWWSTVAPHFVAFEYVWYNCSDFIVCRLRSSWRNWCPSSRRITRRHPFITSLRNITSPHPKQDLMCQSLLQRDPRDLRGVRKSMDGKWTYPEYWLIRPDPWPKNLCLGCKTRFAVEFANTYCIRSLDSLNCTNNRED